MGTAAPALQENEKMVGKWCVGQARFPLEQRGTMERCAAGDGWKAIDQLAHEVVFTVG